MPTSQASQIGQTSISHLSNGEQGVNMADAESYLAKRQAGIDLSVKIREWREERGLTQRELANKMNMPLPTVKRLEEGEASFNISTLINFCVAVGLEINFKSIDEIRDPVEVAEYVLSRCYDVSNGDHDITLFKLLFLIYFIQKAWVEHFDKPLFTNNFQAWNIGPVHVDLYKRYEKQSLLDGYITPSSDWDYFNEKGERFTGLSKEEKEFIDNILFGSYEDYLAYFPPSQLMVKAQRDEAWQTANAKGNTTQMETRDILDV